MAVGENCVDATALVLVDVAPRIEPEGVARIRAFMSQRPDGFDSLEAVADAIASYQPQRKRPRNLDGLAKNVRLGEDGRYRWHWDPRFRGSRPLDLEKRQLRLEACARRLKLPTLLVRGGLSDVITERGVREFRQLCPHCDPSTSPTPPTWSRRPQRHFRKCGHWFLTRAVPVVGTPARSPRELHPHHEGPPGEVQDNP